MTNPTTQTTLTISTIVTKVLQYSCNVSYDDFADDFKKVLGNQYLHDDYIQAKFDDMRENFVWFFCNLDDETKERFTQVVLNHYGIN